MKRILVIDDEGIVRDALKTALSRRGHDVLTAADGASGVAQFSSGRPDLVILARDLPRMRGTEVLRAIRRIDPGAHVIVLTAHDDPEGEAKYRKLGVEHFLSKTIGLETLLSIIEKTLPPAETKI